MLSSRKGAPVLGLSSSLTFTPWTAGPEAPAAQAGPPSSHRGPGAESWPEPYKPRVKIELREEQRERESRSSARPERESET